MRRSLGGVLVVLGIVVATFAWIASGWSHAVLVSASMEPWASPGDLLLHREVPARDIEVGDVVTVPGAGGRLVTHRVVRLTDVGEGRVARLKGDRSRLPDPLPVPLQAEVARVEVVIPCLGDVLMVGSPLLWGGTTLLLVGAAALVVSRRREHPEAPVEAAEQDIEGTQSDPRLDALLATCEQLADDGVPDVVVHDIARVRLATLASLPPAEQADVVLELDDGARFYVIACADADAAALALVPVASQRRRAATAALDEWWAAVRDRLPASTAAVAEAWSPTR